MRFQDELYGIAEGAVASGLGSHVMGLFLYLGPGIFDCDGQATGTHGWQIDHDLGTGGVGDIGTNPVDDYDLFQADLSFKF